jgi:hypothetical protein
MPIIVPVEGRDRLDDVDIQESGRWKDPFVIEDPIEYCRDDQYRTPAEDCLSDERAKLSAGWSY